MLPDLIDANAAHNSASLTNQQVMGSIAAHAARHDWQRNQNQKNDDSIW